MTTIPGRITLDVVEGAENSFDFQWAIDGVAVDLTGCTIEMRFGNSLVALLVVDNDTIGGITTDDLEGIIVVELTAEQTAPASMSGIKSFEIEITHPGGDVTRLLRGAVRAHRVLVGEPEAP